MKNLYALLLAFCAFAAAAGDRSPVAGQLVYLPVYAYLRYGDLDPKGAPKLEEISTLLSVRSTEPERELRLLSFKYYGTDGKLIRELLPRPQVLRPLATAEFFIERRDIEGGSGASAVLKWEAAEPVNPPLVQSVHVEVKVNRAMVFTTEGVVMERAPK